MGLRVGGLWGLWACGFDALRVPGLKGLRA